MVHGGRAVLAMNCVLASTESRCGRPLNKIVRQSVDSPINGGVTW